MWWAWIVSAMVAVLLVVVIVVGWRWSDEPRHRRVELGRAPIRLEEGATATVAFTPDHDGPFVLSLHVPRAKVAGDVLDVMLAGRRCPDGLSPAGARLAYTIRRGGAVDVAGSTGDVLERPSASVPDFQLVYVVKGRPDEYQAEVRVERAVAGLTSAEAVVVAKASGDWIHYRWLEVTIRQAQVLAVAAAIVMAWGIGFTIVRRRDRRRHRAGARPPDSGRPPA